MDWKQVQRPPTKATYEHTEGVTVTP